MELLIMILTHYFPSDLLQISNLDELSKSITKYSPEKQKKIAEQLSNYSGRALRRFDPDQFENYIPTLSPRVKLRWYSEISAVSS